MVVGGQVVEFRRESGTSRSTVGIRTIQKRFGETLPRLLKLYIKRVSAAQLFHVKSSWTSSRGIQDKPCKEIRISDLSLALEGNMLASEVRDQCRAELRKCWSHFFLFYNTRIQQQCLSAYECTNTNSI